MVAGRIFAGTPACTLTAEQEEGPYYIDDETLRRDITEGKPGVPLLLAVALVNSRSCEPLRNAALDIWHCDASGVYSGFTANSPDGGMPPGGPPGGRRGGPPPPGFGGRGRGPRQTDATRFLRGVQITDSHGGTEFSTLYPGWYSGRTIHIHMKVHLGGVADGKYSGGHVTHTGQFSFLKRSPSVLREQSRIQNVRTCIARPRPRTASSGRNTGRSACSIWRDWVRPTPTAFAPPRHWLSIRRQPRLPWVASEDGAREACARV